MEKIGKNFDRTAFLKGANNGNIKRKSTENKAIETKTKISKQFVLSVGQMQKDFIDELVKVSGLKSGAIIHRAVLFVKDEPISIDFMNEYINFVYDKVHGVNFTVQNTMNVNESLKTLSKHYKDIGYNIGIKGVILLYLLYYAKNCLNLDIAQYSNFT